MNEDGKHAAVAGVNDAMGPSSCDTVQDQRQKQTTDEMPQRMEEETEMQWENTPGLICGVPRILLPPLDGDCGQSQTLGAGYEGMDRDMEQEDIRHFHLKMAEVVQG